MTPRDVINSCLPYDGTQVCSSATYGDDIIKNLTAAGYSIVKTEELERVHDDALEEARHGVSNAVLKLSQSDRQNGDILDEAIFRAIHMLKGAKP